MKKNGVDGCKFSGQRVRDNPVMFLGVISLTRGNLELETFLPDMCVIPASSLLKRPGRPLRFVCEIDEFVFFVGKEI